jgi:hypothetical protein
MSNIPICIVIDGHAAGDPVLTRHIVNALSPDEKLVIRFEMNICTTVDGIGSHYTKTHIVYATARIVFGDPFLYVNKGRFESQIERNEKVMFNDRVVDLGKFNDPTTIANEIDLKLHFAAHSELTEFVMNIINYFWNRA